jgi:hypothetical protein
VNLTDASTIGAGMLEGRDRAFLRMGCDAVPIIVAYAGGVTVLHGLR